MKRFIERLGGEIEGYKDGWRRFREDLERDRRESREKLRAERLETGREEGRQLYAEIEALFDSPPEGAKIKTGAEINPREVAWFGIDPATVGEDDRMLVKRMVHPRKKQEVKGAIYSHAGGEYPGGIYVFPSGCDLLMPDGRVEGFRFRKKRIGWEQVSHEGEERFELRDWLEAFKA